MKHVFFVVLFLFYGIAFSQSATKHIDSLQEASKHVNDSTRLRMVREVTFHYIFNDPEKAKRLLKSSISEAKNLHLSLSEAELTNNYGILMDVTGKSDSAKIYFEKALAISRSQKYKKLTSKITNNLGMYHWNKGDNQEALDFFFQALALNREQNNLQSNGTYYNNIGLIYQEMEMVDKALEYHFKALEIRKKFDIRYEIPISFNNIAINLTEKGQYKEAEEALLEGIEMAKEVNEQGVYYNLLTSLSNIYMLQDTPGKAIALLEEILEGRNTSNIDRRANISTYANCIHAFNTIGNYKKALQYIKEGESFLEEFSDLKASAVDFYAASAQTQYSVHNIEVGDHYLTKTLRLKDSLFSSENAENVAALETRFKVSEKERDLAESRANLAERELQIEQKNTLLFGSLGLALVLGLLGYLFYKQQRLKNEQLRKENELKTALARIETQNRLQEQRLRISRDLHDNIGSQLTFIISSIDNLTFGLEGENSKISKKLSTISTFASQTIYELRDTIWAMNKQDITLEDLQGRISNFIEKAGAVKQEVQFRFSVAATVSKETTFTSVQGMNMYRIIQEAVNNAFKYAKASEINVSVSAAQKQITVTITDNGVGFLLEKTAMGNGISNIKKRAKDLGGKAVVLSTLDKGTSVSVTFPLIT
ncbi:tetratricopeptide repeat-containing sensor histidine kinase [Ulvibacter litoralis]|uniref:histidine kinase n=1 Tax=Ulvibacter litoralis TaxID=227084 RepID=A0A1G7C990_9FLAO|nr:sensor histidine kinase [Ulvibacter litoralis]GHC48350.1 two-component sensor histidine kinase [Ulvibacter litoralis]SDE35320.1 Signal transduction histidine kinase [Ulvibacter litoralis]